MPPTNPPTPRAGCANPDCGHSEKAHMRVPGLDDPRLACIAPACSCIEFVPPASAPAATPTCGARDGTYPGECCLNAGHSGDHLRIAPDGVRWSFPPAAMPEPDTFQMAGDVLSGKRRIEDVLAELRPAAPTGEEADAEWTRKFKQATESMPDGCSIIATSAIEEMESRLTTQATALAALRARVEELETALQFYADPKSWKDGNDWPMCLSDAEVDDGDRARAALAPRQPTEGRDDG